MKKAVIIGAGPAGLTAAFELLKSGNIQPIIIEQSSEIGGLAKTINYKGNRIDIGGHRFFSKDDSIIKWWLEILPLDNTQTGNFEISYHKKVKTIQPNSRQDINLVTPAKQMMVRNRKSRIFYNTHFYDYPVTLNKDTISKLGIIELITISFSYLQAKLFRFKKPVTLEDFLINNFGRRLYITFFKDYTEKVWGVPCHKIPAAWGTQRIKDLSLSKTLIHALRKKFSKSSDVSINQKNTSTSLIEKFLYPSLGPGQLWEEVASRVISMGGKIHHRLEVISIKTDQNSHRITSISAKNSDTGEIVKIEGDYFISTMAVQDLINSMAKEMPVPDEVLKVSTGLQYRDFVIIGILLEKTSFSNPEGDSQLTDNWIYVQDKGVQMGRIQFFNNWSPFMVNDENTVWLGLEYFCSKGDKLWNQSDAEFINLGISELIGLGFIKDKTIADSTIIRVEKAYPGYFGSYDDFDTIRRWLDGFSNLFLIGRNGMHKYNNTDHSMLTAMAAVENIKNNSISKENIWSVNTEEEYLEKRVDNTP